MDKNKSKQIKINEIHTVEIIGYSFDGAGVAKLNSGCVVFVERAVRGDVCEVRITKVNPRSCRAEIVRLTKKSEHRIAPDCPVYNKCGGCDFRHISYKEELFAKKTRVNDALKRIGGVKIETEEVLTAGETDGYRNHIQLKIDCGKVGFYSAASHTTVDIESCKLASPNANRVIRCLREWVRRNDIRGVGTARIRTSKDGVMTVLNADKVITLDSHPYITEVLDGLSFRISAESFFQVNSAGAEVLYKKALEFADLKPHEFLLDLYCGTGTITLFLGRDAGHALGVESNESAVENARINAELNGVHNAEFLCADVSDFDFSGLNPNCVVVDPPRKGLDSRTLRKILEMSPTRIVYISCDPATLARDVKLLTGYTVSRVCAVDMFPRTRHVECVIILE
ncbi:MAG: 23S rRNA (uracil(1939)-C(5))-methyltransferase RlmD [Oscillospiraceae bacterium]|nr:23S rRNA (uracil(1939)-C(5))-methyltransferase RlmD [Oscillospiraceae bacterium]